ncbi:MAG TPA: YkgJ family cysteine cluster protein [Candidatus Hydrogenedentes bacterium]|nr:MAG: Flagellin N-methylase [Candidatus Hydrogenedentes bacterium ADurb.Bin170]HPK24910.1 YkgJ family cysteine cluster protein [Candidatus Hydrogenedentota bacterium]
MGKQTVRFQCHHSGHCCRDVVCLPTPWDVLRIAMNIHRDPHDFIEFLTPDEIEGVSKSDPTWLIIGDNRYIMALQRTPEEGCFFLDRKTYHCTIYEHRPLLCRLYPFKLHETRTGEFSHFSLHQDVGCPRFRDGVVETAPLYDLYLQDKMHQEDYVKIVNRFNALEDDSRSPEHFLDLFVEVVQAGDEEG